jgi:cAMP-dependent protein kinase regulator
MNKPGVSRPSSMKEEAQRALSRGESKKALDLFQSHCRRVPADLRSRLKVAELLERLGERKKAIEEYRRVGEAYTAEGFLLKAISVYKVLLRIDPSSEETESHLKRLYQARAEEMRSFQSYLHLPFFSELHEGERELLFQHFQVKRYERNSMILQEGEEGDSLLIIARGEVLVNKQRRKGREVPLGSLGPGEVLGEIGLLVDRKRHATVRALTACEILEVSKKRLDEIAESQPRIKEGLSRLLKKRVFDTFLALSPLFFSLNSAEREEIMGRFHLRKIPGDTLLFRGGDPPDSFYFIKSGEVEIFTQDREAKRIRLGTLRSGNFFGEIGVFLDKPRMAYARTTATSELLELTKEEFGKCLAQFPVLRLNLKEISTDRLGTINEILSFPVLRLNLKEISTDRLGTINEILSGKEEKQAREVGA